MKSHHILYHYIALWLCVFATPFSIIAQSGTPSLSIQVRAVTELDYNTVLTIQTSAKSYTPGYYRFFYDIAFDSTFQTFLPGWKNRELPIDGKKTLYGDASYFSIDGVFPESTYYIRGKVIFTYDDFKDTSAYSKTTSATVSSWRNTIILPIQILDSTSAVVRWVPYKNIPNYRVSATHFPLLYETTCGEPWTGDTTLVPIAYRNSGKRVSRAVQDTIRGLTPNVQYRFRVVIDTIGLPSSAYPSNALSSSFGVSGFTADGRNKFSNARKFLSSFSYGSLPFSQSISYYETPWIGDTSRYFTISDSNGTGQGINLKDFASIKNVYERVLSRLDSAKKVGIPIDTAYIALEGTLGAYGRAYTGEIIAGGTECYFARVTCVFTLRRPDTRVKQFARPGNGWRSFSWDTDYRRFVFPTTTSVRDENTDFVSGTPTLQSNPNPFTDETTITYTLPSEANTKVEVFSTLGLRMAVFHTERHVAGTYTIPLQATQWASGTYLVRLTMFDAVGSIRTITHKISLLH